MKKPMTTAEYFKIICNILSEKDKMPDILDYKLSTSDVVPIKTYEFNIGNNLDYGSNESIYLYLWIEIYSNRENRIYELGTFKTLQEKEKAMHIMAGLLADFLIEARAYVNGHLDDFTWEGADVHAIQENGTVSPYGYTCSTMEAAMKRKDILLYFYPLVVIRDNATRKERIYSKERKEGYWNKGKRLL